MRAIRKTKGYCPCCKKNTAFVAEDYWLRDYYKCQKCGSIPRNRALSHVISKIYPNIGDLKIHESSPSRSTLERRSAECREYTYSYFYEDMPLGKKLENSNASNQNLEKMTFADNSFDVFITEDVMEHIYDPVKALREIYRVLKHGGGISLQCLSIVSKKQDHALHLIGMDG